MYCIVNEIPVINVTFIKVYNYIYCTDAVSKQMNVMKNIEIDELKRKIQTEATGK